MYFNNFKMEGNQESKIDRYGFYTTSDTASKRFFKRFMVANTKEIDRENRRILKWLDMLKDWKR